MKNLFSTLAMTLTVFVFGFGQNIDPAKFNQLREKADIVVFGELSEKESFWNPTGNMIFTSNHIKVFSTLKGEHLDEVEIITNGGRVDFIQQNWSHFPQIPDNSKGYFFIQRLPGDIIRSGEILKLISQDGFIPILGKKKVTVAQFQMMADTIVEFDFDNIDFEEPNFLNFDVLIRSNIDGLDFGKGELFMNYPTEVFGSSVVDNESIEASKGDVINSSEYSISLYDDETDIFQAAVTGGCTDATGAESGIPLSTEFQSFLRVQLEVQDFTALGSISMDDVRMEGNVFYANPSAEGCLPFDDVIVPNPIDVESICNISSFGEAVVTAGTSDTLDIRGMNFEMNPGTVEFPDADTGGLKLFQVLPQDIVFWSDTLVRVLVPTDPSPAGSGIFQIRTATGMVCQSPTPLDVCFGVLSTHRGDGDSTTYRVNLGDVNNDSSYVFRPDTTLAADTVAIMVIEKALCDWNDATQINAKLGEVYTGSSPSLDNINHIFVAPESVFADSPNAWASTIQTLNVCFNIPPVTGVLFDYVDDVEIAVRGTLPGGNTWYVSCDSMPSSTQADFYSVMIHELGHAFHLEHTVPDDKLMFWELKPGQVKRTLHNKDIMGVNDILDTSATGLDQGLSTCPTPVGRKDLCTTTSVTNLSRYEDVKVYPNPVMDNEVFVELDLPNSSEVGIEVYSSSGTLILNIADKNVSSGNHIIPVDIPEKLPSGIYLIKVRIGNQYQIAKLLKF